MKLEQSIVIKKSLLGLIKINFFFLVVTEHSWKKTKAAPKNKETYLPSTVSAP